MKQKLLISEKDLVGLIKTIVESDFDTSDYDELDLKDIFINFYRTWIRNKFPDTYDNYPLSFLIKKHFVDFANDFGLDVESFRGYHGDIELNRYRIGSLIKELLEKGKITLPKVPTQAKITDRFKKAIDFFLNDLKLPPYAKIDIDEPRPYKIMIDLTFDFPNFLKTSGNIPNRHTLETKFQDFLEKYLGLEIGDPTHGEVSINVSNPKYLGQEEWVKNELNKYIKKKMKELPKSNLVHSVRFSSEYTKPELKISFKDIAGWNDRKEIKKGIEKLLEDLGYVNIKVEN